VVHQLFPRPSPPKKLYRFGTKYCHRWIHLFLSCLRTTLQLNVEASLLRVMGHREFVRFFVTIFFLIIKVYLRDNDSTSEQHAEWISFFDSIPKTKLILKQNNVSLGRYHNFTPQTEMARGSSHNIWWLNRHHCCYTARNISSSCTHTSLNK